MPKKIRQTLSLFHSRLQRGPGSNPAGISTNGAYAGRSPYALLFEPHLFFPPFFFNSSILLLSMPSPAKCCHLYQDSIFIYIGNFFWIHNAGTFFCHVFDLKFPTFLITQIMSRSRHHRNYSTHLRFIGHLQLLFPIIKARHSNNHIGVSVQHGYFLSLSSQLFNDPI